jgi:hypothetical protein
VDGRSTLRLFSLQEANGLLPMLREEFTRTRSLRDDLLLVQRRLTEAGRGIDGPDVTVDETAPESVQRLQMRAIRLIAQMREILRELSELGVEVKAADGLVDFRSKLRGRTVLLCWQYGEDRVSHFHELQAGFAGRKPLPDHAVFVGDLLH